MDIQKYLERIQYSGSLTPNWTTLQALQQAHLLHVPFENLDIHQDKVILLDLDRIFQKVVIQNRGGFCYELNGIFFELLKNIGFEVKRIAARVCNPKGELGPPCDHLATIVKIDKKEYIADVGFGNFCFSPLTLELDTVQKDKWWDFRLRAYDDHYWAIDKIVDGAWTLTCIFDLLPRDFQEFVALCHYHQTSPNSHFTQQRLCTLPTKDGRATLIGDLLTIKKEGEEKKEITIKGEKELAETLWTYFKIKL